MDSVDFRWSFWLGASLQPELGVATSLAEADTLMFNLVVAGIGWFLYRRRRPGFLIHVAGLLWPLRNSTQTSIDSLAFQVGDHLRYLFDPGVECWHVVELTRLEERCEGSLKYPGVIEKRGESPSEDLSAGSKLM